MKIFINGSIKDHKTAFPNISFPNDDAVKAYALTHGAYLVSDIREFNSETEKLVSCEPVIENDVAYIVSVQPKTQADLNVDQEAKSIFIRGQRDLLLSKSDWTQVEDAPVNKEAWATYRQALRDIPNQEGFPSNVTWPTQPE